MTRLAFAGKCVRASGYSGLLASRLGFSNEPSAAVPSPAAVREKKWRRVRSKRCSLRGSIGQWVSGSVFGNGFVQVQDEARDGRPGGKLRFVDIAGGLPFTDRQELVGGG